MMEEGEILSPPRKNRNVEQLPSMPLHTTSPVPDGSGGFQREFGQADVMTSWPHGGPHGGQPASYWYGWPPKYGQYGWQNPGWQAVRPPLPDFPPPANPPLPPESRPSSVILEQSMEDFGIRPSASAPAAAAASEISLGQRAVDKGMQYAVIFSSSHMCGHM